MRRVHELVPGEGSATADVVIVGEAPERFAEHAKISKIHGQLLEARGRALFPMYHPAAVLHVQRLRETVIADARALGETLAALLARAAYSLDPRSDG